MGEFQGNDETQMQNLRKTSNTPFLTLTNCSMCFEWYQLQELTHIFRSIYNLPCFKIQITSSYFDGTIFFSPSLLLLPFTFSDKNVTYKPRMYPDLFLTKCLNLNIKLIFLFLNSTTQLTLVSD